MSDSWEDGGWEADEEPSREDVLRLARQIAEQRAQQRAQDLAELDELKRTLRERAAEVAAREAEVERAWAEIHERANDTDTVRRRILRLRRERPPGDRPDRPGRGDGIAEREATVARRQAELSARERQLAGLEASLQARAAELEKREQAGASEAGDQGLVAESERLQRLAAELRAREDVLAEREGAIARREQASKPERAHGGEEPGAAVAERAAELRGLESRLASREADILRLQTALAAREEELRRRERDLDDAERLRERAAVIPIDPYMSFSEGLDSLAGRSERRLG
jgi:chromosome segregation ATPase